MTDYKFLEQAIKKVMAYYSIPGCALAIIDKGETNYLQFGYSNIEEKMPFTVDTISGIGSCTKSMTAFLAGRLAAKGILDIDAPVASYIPDFALWDDDVSAKVTVRDMLCHRTGLGGHDGTWPDNSITRVDFLKRLRYMEPNMPYRTYAQYSNVMYVAVGGIMEAVTGKKWETLMEEEVFAPLGMTRTFCLMADAEKEKDCALPYWWQQGLRAVPRWNIDMAGPCGSVMSTAKDMAQWLLMHIQKGVWQGSGLLSQASFQDQHSPQIMMDYPHVQGGYSLGYGLGWRVLDYHGHIVQQHTGKIEGYSAFQFYLPEAGSGAVFLQNLHAPDNPFIFTVQGLLLDYFLGRETQDWVSIYTEKREHAPEDMYHHLEFNFMPQKAAAGTATSYELAAYAGDYYHPAYGIFKICLEKGRLWLHERDIFYRPMTHFHYDTFQVEQIKEDTDIYTLPLIFLIDEAKHVVAGFALQMEPKVKEIVFSKIQS